MSSNLDKSLADVISSRPKNNKRRGARRTSGKASIVGSQTQKATATPATRSKTQAQAKTQPTAPQADKIIVSNLPPDVNEAQIKELFSTQIGPTKEVTLNYDHAGRSKGTASVVFSRRGDGTKAFQQYNNRLIDGKRPMKVEVVIDPTKAHPQPTLSERVGPAPAAAVGTTKAQSVTRGKRRARGGKKKGAERPIKTAEDLDAEMADYTGASAAPPTA